MPPGCWRSMPTAISVSSREQWHPFDTEDPAGLADRRKAAGLSSLDEYVKQMNGICVDGHLPASSALQFRKAQLSDGEDVVVTKDGIVVAGETVHTPEELMKLLAARQILKIRVKRESSEVHYTTLGKIIYGAQRPASSSLSWSRLSAWPAPPSTQRTGCPCRRGRCRRFRSRAGRAWRR